MDSGILSGQALFRNDILMIEHIIEHSFDSMSRYSTSFFSDYLQTLSTLVGLGFTAALTDRHLLYRYQAYLTRYLAAEEREFKLDNQAKKGVAHAVSKMVHTASLCFYALRFPAYYSDFIAALRGTLTQIPGFCTSQQEVESLLKRLVVP